MALKEDQAPTQPGSCLTEDKAVAPLSITPAGWMQQGAIRALAPAGLSKTLLSTNAFHILSDAFQK